MTNLWQKLTSKWWKKSVQTVENVIDTTEKTLSSAATSAGQLVEGTAKAAVDITNQAVDMAVDCTDKAVDTVGNAAKVTLDTAIDCTDKAVDAVGDTAKAAVDVAGQAVGVAMDYSGKAVDAVGDGIGYLKQSMINTGKFLVDEQYRNEEVFPWIKSIIRDNWGKIKQEASESEDMMMVLWKYSQGKEISDEENKAAKEQLYDLIRMVPALGIFALPGGAILLPLLARALPWDLMPSSFRTKVEEEYGKDALQQELTSQDKVPVDNNAEIPADIQQNIKEKAPELVQQANIVISENN